MGKVKQNFKEYLELNRYAPNTIKIYLLYESLLPNNLNQTSINNFIKDHNTLVARSFLRLYLYRYLKIDEKEIEIPRFVYKHKKIPKVVLYFEEVKKFLKETKDLDIKIAIRLGFISGLRVSEMVGDGYYITPLTPDAIDFKRLTVSGTGKGNKDYIQPINVPTAKLLKLYITKYKLKHNDRILDMSRQNLYRILHNECLDIIGKKIGVHTLRTSLGTYLAECNWNPIKIKEYLRHDKLETVMKYIILSRKHITQEWKNTKWL